MNHIEKFKIKLEEILDQNFPKGECLERGRALVLFSYAVIYLKEALEELQKERIMAIDAKVLKEWKKGSASTLKNIREELAALEHEQWILWSKDIAKTEKISSTRFERWQELWRPYSKLTETEKDQDREWADKVIRLFVESL